VSIPYGQRFITIDIAPANQILFEEPNLFVEETVTNVRRGIVQAALTTIVKDDGAGGTAAYDSAINSAGETVVRYFPYFRSGGISPTISDFELYINNIFVNPEVHDIYIRRIGFSLIRVHLTASLSTTSPGEDERLLTQLKWPIEYIFLGLRPRWNITADNRHQWRDWHRLTKVNTGRFDADYSQSVVSSTTPGTNGQLAAASHSRSSIEPVAKAEYVSVEPTVSRLRVSAHGVTLYDEYDSNFYGDYMAYHYGGLNLTTPNDPGALMINFALYPGTYQPSGHINVSRAREFNVRWTTPYVSASTTADLLVCASAINFLLISDGSAVLRFST
jgi:hypothetical protein